MVLRTTPLLEKLNVYHRGVAGLQDCDSKVNFDRVLIGLSRPSLFQPLGAGLKQLCISSGSRLAWAMGSLLRRPRQA
jgi:hypothetical protein